ncbi:hypothetical protein ABPG72_000467 [Tetrahymena utriculariae]
MLLPNNNHIVHQLNQNRNQGNNNNNRSNGVISRNRYLRWLREWSQPARGDNMPSLYHYLSRREYLWRLVFFASTCFGIFLIEKIYIFHTDQKYSSIEKTELVDFLLSFLVVILIVITRILVKHLFFDKIKQFLKCDQKKIQKYQQMICERIVQISFYVVMSIWGLLLISDVEKRLEVKTYHDIFKNGRYLNQLFSESPFLIRYYYLVQIGYHIFFFVEAYIWNLQNQKYYEWLLHHGIALILLFYSYMFNFLIVGLYVLFLHNISDLGLVIARTYTILKWKKAFVTYILYIIEYFVWVYARNYIFPFQIIYYAIYEYNQVAHSFIFQWSVFYLICLMVSLAAMHLYWTYFITQALLYMILSGIEYNTYDQ